MCCPPAPGLGGLPSAYGRARAEAAAQEYFAKKAREASQTDDVVSESDQEKVSIHDNDHVEMNPRQSLRTRCRQMLKKYRS